MAEEIKRFNKSMDIKTVSVAKAIQDVASKERVHPASIDFDILQTKTFVRPPGEEEYQPLNKTHLERIKQPKGWLLDPRFQIAQEYHIRLKPLSPGPFRLKVKVLPDEFRSKAIARILPGSVLAPVENIKQQLFIYFNKLKLRHGMLIGIMDDPLKLAIVKLAKIASQEPIKQQLNIPLTAWPEPVKTVDDAIIFHYKEKDAKSDEEKRVNYADRGFVTSVDSGELLVEYIQPQKGKPGRSYNGAFIEMPDPEVNHYPEFGVDNKTIEVKSEEGRKRYYALDEGYVKLENNVLTVDKTVTVGDINLKSTGNVRAGVDKDVKVQVAGKDPSEEVIGSDMVVEAMEVEVNGSVASNAKIKAGSIQISGQTHKTSELYGETVEVNVLRGLACGKRVTIKSLEGGVIRSDEASVEQAVGGEIYASHAKVRDLRGKSRILASRSIAIEQVLKGENRLTIDPMAHKETADRITQTQEAVSELQSEIAKSKKGVENNTAYLKKNHETFKQMQQQIMEDKKEGRVPSEAFMRMVREYLGVMKKREALEAHIQELEEQVEAKRAEVACFDEQVLSATVTNSSAKWLGHNEVRFRLPVLGKEYLYSVSEGERIAKLKLMENEQGEYEIMTVHG